MPDVFWYTSREALDSEKGGSNPPRPIIIMKLIYKRLLYIALFIPILYIFTWLHEGGHVLGAILSGNEVYEINVGILGGKIYVWYFNYSTRWIICIMGSIATLVIAVPLFIYSIKKKNKWVLLIAFIQVGKEILYWMLSPHTQHGDAYNLITWSKVQGLWIVEMAVYNISYFCIVALILLHFIFLYYNNTWMLYKDELLRKINR